MENYTSALYNIDKITKDEAAEAAVICKYAIVQYKQINKIVSYFSIRLKQLGDFLFPYSVVCRCVVWCDFFYFQWETTKKKTTKSWIYTVTVFHEQQAGTNLQQQQMTCDDDEYLNNMRNNCLDLFIKKWWKPF